MSRSTQNSSSSSWSPWIVHSIRQPLSPYPLHRTHLHSDRTSHMRAKTSSSLPVLRRKRTQCCHMPKARLEKDGEGENDEGVDADVIKKRRRNYLHAPVGTFAYPPSLPLPAFAAHAYNLQPYGIAWSALTHPEFTFPPGPPTQPCGPILPASLPPAPPEQFPLVTNQRPTDTDASSL